MNKEEADKIIAEFMGYSFDGTDVIKREAGNYYDIPYSKSLDKLVPVWEKLGISYFDCDMNHGNENISMVFMKHFPKEMPTYKTGLMYGKTIQEAACIATAKAIRELK